MNLADSGNEIHQGQKSTTLSFDQTWVINLTGDQYSKNNCYLPIT